MYFLIFQKISRRKCTDIIFFIIGIQHIPESLKALENNIETRFSQMLSAFIETLRVEKTHTLIK